MAQWLDLKPDRRLIDSDFEGYRLSLDKLHCTEKPLHQGECHSVNHESSSNAFIPDHPHRSNDTFACLSPRR